MKKGCVHFLTYPYYEMNSVLNIIEPLRCWQLQFYCLLGKDATDCAINQSQARAWCQCNKTVKKQKQKFNKKWLTKYIIDHKIEETWQQFEGGKRTYSRGNNKM